MFVFLIECEYLKLSYVYIWGQIHLKKYTVLEIYKYEALKNIKYKYSLSNKTTFLKKNSALESTFMYRNIPR